MKTRRTESGRFQNKKSKIYAGVWDVRVAHKGWGCSWSAQGGLKADFNWKLHLEGKEGAELNAEVKKCEL